MGKGEIISEDGQGQYTIDVLYDRSKYDAIIADLDDRIAVLTAEIADLQTQLAGDPDNVGLQTKLKFAKVHKLSAEKRKEYMQDNAPETSRKTVWCADYTTGLTGIVGTLELPGNGDAGTVQIAPGFDDDAAYSQADHGIMTHAVTESPAAAFYNLAMLPGWQRWRPLFRRGTILSIDRDLGTATVRIEDATSFGPINAVELDVNESDSDLEDVPFDYMSCDHAAFAEDDEIVVKFRGQADGDGWTDPVIIGFQTNPKMCGVFYMAYMDGNYLRWKVNEHSRSINIENALKSKWIDLGFSGPSFTGLDDVYAVAFADAYPFRVGVICSIDPASGKYLAGRYAVVMVNVDEETLAMTTEAVYYYSVLQELEDDEHRITDCEGNAASTEDDPESLPMNLGDLVYNNACDILLGPFDCELKSISNGLICSTYPCCHRLYCPTNGEYADCTEDPCNGHCYLEHNGAPVGFYWCYENEYCVDWQDHYRYCEDNIYGDPCVSYMWSGVGDCDEEFCTTSTGCGSASVNVDYDGHEFDDECVNTDNIGPVPFGLAFGKEGTPTVYLYGYRQTPRITQNFSLSGTQCTNSYDGCGCTDPWAGAEEEQLYVGKPTGFEFSPGFDVWKASAASLYGDYSVGTVEFTAVHDGYTGRISTRGECSSNHYTLNNFTPTLWVVLGIDIYAWNQINGVWDYNDPGGWSYENLGITEEKEGLTWSYPGVPGGEDPDNGNWQIMNGIRDSGYDESLVYDWGSAYARGASSLGWHLALIEGLENPLDEPDRVACLVSSRDLEFNPGFAICISRSKVQAFAGFQVVGGKLSPVGDAVYEWSVNVSPTKIRQEFAFFTGSVEGVTPTW